MSHAKTMEGFHPLKKSKAEWEKLLPADRYAILFEESTERPFSSPLEAEKRAGTFVCAACFLPLFSSEAIFESGTGWPSFFQALPGRVATKRDFKLLLPRTVRSHNSVFAPLLRTPTCQRTPGPPSLDSVVSDRGITQARRRRDAPALVRDRPAPLASGLLPQPE